MCPGYGVRNLRHQLKSKSFLAVSVAVGTALVLLNHGERLVTGALAWDLVWKLLATYVGAFLMVAYLGPANTRR